MLRELGYGLLFYVFTIAGAFAGLNLLTRAVSDSVDGPAVDVTNAILGAVVGGGFWLYLKYGCLTPRKR